MRHLFALTGLAAALGATGCDRIASVNVGPPGTSVTGEGEAATETRQTPDFDRISVASIIRAHYTQGPKQVTVSAQPNLMSHVVTRVESGLLIIELTGRVNDAKQIDVAISSPVLTGAEASGASSIELLKASGNDCALAISGAAQITGASNFKTLTFDVSGNGSATLSGLTNADIKGELSGASQLDLDCPIDSVDLSASGNSTIKIPKISAERVAIRLDGASQATLGGSASNIQIEASGSSQADLSGLKSQTATASADGALQLKIDVQRALTATASGASQVTYSGSPQSVVRNIDGAAQVNRA